MPELPEIETLKLYMQEHLPGQVIEAIKLNRDNLRYECTNLNNITFPSLIKELKRRAKYLIIKLENNNSIVIHLGMSGRFTLAPPNYNYLKHDHVIFHLKGGRKLVFNDPRRFGMIYHILKEEEESHQIFSLLGVEPLSEELNSAYLLSKFKGRKTSIKTALMDNSILVGVGNIYAAESLFLAKINPVRPAGVLSELEVTSLIKAIKEVLYKAIKAKGTTLKDFVSGDNRPGYFKQKLLVYGRDGASCYICQTAILKIKQAGRSTFYCPNCQL